MLGALIIVFREILEAGLIVGVILAATRTVPHRGRWVALGILAGGLGAGLVAVFAGQLARLFHDSGQELFNACVLFAAVAMLAAHNIWMSRHGREMAQNARAFGQSIASGSRPLMAVAGIVAVAVLREGSEIVLFLFGLSTSDGGMSMALGAALGLAAGALCTALIYLGLLTVPVRHFFSVTSVLLTLLAAGLASQAISFLQQGDYFEIWSNPLWNTSRWIEDGSWTGRILHTLIGYTDQPTGLQLAVYLTTLLGIFILTLRSIPRPRTKF